MRKKYSNSKASRNNNGPHWHGISDDSRIHAARNHGDGRFVGQVSSIYFVDYGTENGDDDYFIRSYTHPPLVYDLVSVET